MATRVLSAVQIADSKIELREFDLLEKMHPPHSSAGSGRACDQDLAREVPGEDAIHIAIKL